MTLAEFCITTHSPSTVFLYKNPFEFLAYFYNISYDHLYLVPNISKDEKSWADILQTIFYITKLWNVIKKS